MMKAKINTNLFPIIRVGMYEDRLSPQYLFGYDIRDSDDAFSDTYFWDNFKYDEYVKEIERQAEVFFRHEVYSADGIDIKVKAGSIYSPREYNFATDQIDITVEYNKRHILKYAKDNQIEFDDFLREKYSSRDGFMSFTSNRYTDWLEAFKNNDDQEIGAVLCFIFKDEVEDIQGHFFEQVQENVYHSEFCDWTAFDNEMDIIRTFVQENYNTIDINDFQIDHCFEAIADVSVVAKSIYLEINNQTLKLCI